MVSGILGGAIGGAAVNIVIRAIDNYSKQFKKLDKSVKKQQTGFKKLTGFLKSSGLGYALLAGAAVGFGVSAVKAAVASEQAMQQFELAVGDAADTMLTDMRKASKGMISDFELVKNANAAMALGIKKNDIPALLEAATARAKVFGRTASQAFNDLSIGIGRQSRLILDNLGIILDLDTVYTEYATTVGKVADELTEMEKKQALVNSILEDSEGLVKAQIFLEETHADKLQRLSATYSNAKESIGLFMLEVFDEISGISASEEALKNKIDTMTGIEGTYDIVAEAVLDLSNREKELTDELKASNDAAKDLIDSLLNLSDITFKGERGGSLAIAEQKERIRQIELAKARGADVGGVLESERDKLAILRLEQERFSNERDIQQATNAINLEEIGELESITFSIFKENEEKKFQLLDDERLKQESIRTTIKNVQTATKDLVTIFSEGQTEKEKGYDAERDSIEELIRKTNELTASYGKAATARSLAGVDISMEGPLARFGISTRTPGRSFSVGDAIIRPNGDVIKTDPRDTLIATKNPGGMGGGITLIVQGNLIGLDAEDISRSLSDELGEGVSL